MNTVEDKNKIAAAEAAVAADPAAPDSYLKLGMAHFFGAHFDRALTAFQRAQELDPAFAPAYNWIGRAYYHLGPAQAAIDHYSQAINLDEAYLEPYIGLGILYFSQIGDYEAALDAFRRGLAQHPNNPLLITFIGNTYARMGDFDEALARLQEALSFAPDSTFALSNLNLLYLHLGRYDDVIATCRREIGVEDSAEPRRLLGYAYSLLGRQEKAVAELERAVALSPKDYEARGALARLLRLTGRQAKADEHYARATDLAAQDNEYGQACFAAVTGAHERAIELLAVALAKGQLQPGWARIDPEFVFLQAEPQYQALLAGYSA